MTTSNPQQRCLAAEPSIIAGHLFGQLRQRFAACSPPTFFAESPVESFRGKNLVDEVPVANSQFVTAVGFTGLLPTRIGMTIFEYSQSLQNSCGRRTHGGVSCRCRCFGGCVPPPIIAKLPCCGRVGIVCCTCCLDGSDAASEFRSRFVSVLVRNRLMPYRFSARRLHSRVLNSFRRR